MLDQLGRIDVRDYDRRVERRINLPQSSNRALRADPDHNSVWLHQILYRKSLAQKFGIADDVEVCAVTIVSLDRFSHLFACFHRHRAFVHNHPIIRQHACDFARDFLEKTKIDIPACLLGSGNGDKNDLRIIYAVLDAAAETQALR